jgi:hypothetical protein
MARVIIVPGQHTKPNSTASVPQVRSDPPPARPPTPPNTRPSLKGG